MNNVSVPPRVEPLYWSCGVTVRLGCTNVCGCPVPVVCPLVPSVVAMLAGLSLSAQPACHPASATNAIIPTMANHITVLPPPLPALFIMLMSPLEGQGGRTVMVERLFRLQHQKMYMFIYLQKS